MPDPIALEDPEDRKLVTLARATMARAGAAQGALVHARHDPVGLEAAQLVGQHLRAHALGQASIEFAPPSWPRREQEHERDDARDVPAGPPHQPRRVARVHGIDRKDQQQRYRQRPEPRRPAAKGQHGDRQQHE